MHLTSNTSNPNHLPLGSHSLQRNKQTIEARTTLQSTKQLSHSVQVGKKERKTRKEKKRNDRNQQSTGESK
jgi:hypothetical protein